MPQLNTPILLLVFNRLRTTQQVLAAIRQVRPTRLYVAADGPRIDRLGESAKVQAVRDYILSQIDWNCQVKTLFREQNLGCRLAVSQAIDWFFEQELEGIILEDDCLPDASFFPYATELLQRYRHDQRVMAIAGTHPHGDGHQPPYSYFFSRNIEVWGWASWQRAWQHYDRDMKQWPSLRNTDWLLTIGDGDRRFQRHWTRIFDQTFAGEIDTWDYQWVFSCWCQNGLTTLPAQNLIHNLGFGEAATHTTDSGTNRADDTLATLKFPLSHPTSVTKDYHADRWVDRQIDQITFYRGLKLQLRQVPPLQFLKKLGQRFKLPFASPAPMPTIDSIPPYPP